MFSRLTSVIYDAVDYLAPPTPPQEEFEYHWSQTTNFFTNKSSSAKAPIETTKIPEHLQCMSIILEQEESQSENVDNFGPCLEFFLQHKLSSTMCEFATADTPPGMKGHILTFFKYLIAKSKHSLLDHVSIHNSILKLIKLCGEIVASPSETEEIEFLEIVCQNLKQMPHLIASFFIAEPLTSALQNLQLDSNIKHFSNFPLISSLLNLLQSPDCNVRVKAGVNIILCASMVNDDSAKLIVEQTKLTETLIKKLVNLYLEIPKTFSPTELGDMDIKWDSVALLNPFDAQISLPLRKVVCFIVWYDLLNKLTSQANLVISDSILNLFNQELIEKIFFSDLIKNSDANTQLMTTSIITCCLRHSSCVNVQNLLINFFLDDGYVSRLEDEECLSIRKVLIKRCQNIDANSELAIETLHLFDQILRKPTESILSHLVINNIRTRSYYDSSINFDLLSDDDENKEDAEAKEEMKQAVANTSSSPIHKIINCFLYLVPDNIKSCNSHESSYETYIHDVKKCYQSCFQMCKHWDWPKEAVEFADETLSSDSQPEADSGQFHEGMFLGMLLTNLEHMLDFPYDLTLLVTSLISRLSLFPHPNLTEFLLNPLLPLKGDTRSLFSILLTIADELYDRSQTIPDLKEQLKSMRLYLLSDDIDTNIPFDNFQILQCIIVIEEFCKELAAIAYVKHNLQCENFQNTP